MPSNHAASSAALRTNSFLDSIVSSLDRDGNEIWADDTVTDAHGDDATIVRVFKNGKILLHHNDYVPDETVPGADVALLSRAG